VPAGPWPTVAQLASGPRHADKCGACAGTRTLAEAAESLRAVDLKNHRHLRRVRVVPVSQAGTAARHPELVIRVRRRLAADQRFGCSWSHDRHGPLFHRLSSQARDQTAPALAPQPGESGPAQRHGAPTGYRQPRIRRRTASTRRCTCRGRHQRVSAVGGGSRRADGTSAGCAAGHAHRLAARAEE
jgi:hypothetical protein